MGTLLDTSVLIDLERQRGALAPADEVAIAAITASELLHGVLRASSQYRPRREAFVEAVLATIPTIPFSLRIARAHAGLWARAAADGRKPDAHDLLIASTAIALGWPLATTDRKHFLGIQGLVLAEGFA